MPTRSAEGELNQEIIWRRLGLLPHRALSGGSMVRALKAFRSVERVYGRSLGGVDNVSLEEHTLSVLACYEEFFERRERLVLSDAQFKLLLSLHDLGKPRAVAEGRLEMQHRYTTGLIDALRVEAALPEALLQPLKVLICGDPIGRCLNKKFHASIDESRDVVSTMAVTLGISISDCWSTILVYYQCDVSGYESLRQKVFSMDSRGRQLYSTEKRRFLFRDMHEASRFDALEQAIES